MSSGKKRVLILRSQLEYFISLVFQKKNKLKIQTGTDA